MVSAFVLLGSLLIPNGQPLPVVTSGTFNTGVARTATIAVKVAPVRSVLDITSLADLRFREFIADTYFDVSQSAFRKATAELYHDRIAGGACAFLAELHDEENSGSRASETAVVVGTAELSPMEFDGVQTTSSSHKDHKKLLYVTDVVTSSAHRRMGVGDTLMIAMEMEAIRLGASQLFLHVDRDNTSALRFYENPKLGYSVPLASDLDGIDTDRLAQNTGTEGQILLGKVLDLPLSVLPVTPPPAGTGFG